MKTLNPNSGVLRYIMIIMAAACFLMAAPPAFSAGTPIATLSEFSGTVLIRSQDSWGVKPVVGLSLYSEDKVVTRMGKAVITFNDGAVMEIQPNSNLLVREFEEEEKGLTAKVTSTKRHLRLLLGKMFFKTGSGSGTNTRLETTTMVCGLRGTAGVISIGADGQTYLQFSEGGGDTVGNFISGVAEDVPPELANLSPVQRAAFVAAAAAQQAAQAAERAASGEIGEADAALAGAQAAELAAREAKTAAEAMLNNPDSEIQAQAAAAIAAAEAAIAAAQKAQAEALEAGATPGSAIESYEPPEGEGGFDTEPTELPQGVEDDIPPEIGSIPPVISINSGPGAFSNIADPYFELSATKPVTWQYILDGGDPFPMIGNTLNLDSLLEGGHTIIFIATDEDGNTSASTYAWTTDYTSPVASIPTSPDIIDNTSGFGFAATDANAAAGITYQYSIDGGITWTTTGTTLNLGLATDGTADGSRTIQVRATDAAGNISSVLSFTWTYDTIVPVASIPTSPDIIDNTSGFGFAATDANAAAGITYEYSLDNGATWTDTGSTLNLTLAATTGTAYTIQVRATDAAGNVSPVRTYTWTYDTVAPTVALSASPDGAGTAAVTASYTNTEPSTNVTYAYSPASTGLNDGVPYTITVTATDKAGNVSSTPFTFTLDLSSLTGDVAGTGSVITGTATSTTVAVEGQTWGGWETSMSGTWSGPHTGPLSMAAGGYTGLSDGGLDGVNALVLEPIPVGNDGYWLSIINGSVDKVTGAATGTSNFTMLTPTSLSHSTGSFTGSFPGTGGGSWTGTEKGTGLVNQPLMFVSQFDAPILRSQAWEIWWYEYSDGYYNYEYSTDNTEGYLSHQQYSGINYWKDYYIEDGVGYWYGYDSGGTETENGLPGSISGTWSTSTPLSDILGPPPGGWIWYDEYSDMESRYAGYLGGLAGGPDSLFGPTAQTEGVPVTSVGDIGVDGRTSIWLDKLWNMDWSEINVTSDGGAYIGYGGGIHYGNKLEGNWVAIGISPSGKPGLITGDLEGNVYINNMFKMDGLLKWTPMGNDGDFLPSSLADNLIYGYGGFGGDMLNSGTQGYGGYGGLQGSFYGSPSSGKIESGGYGGFGILWTTALATENKPFGVYSLSVFGKFENPDNYQQFTSHVGGYGGFGQFDAWGEDDPSYGFWLGETKSTWTGGRIDAEFLGRFVTGEMMGDISGNFLGTYDDSAGTWEAVSLGTWEGDYLDMVGYWGYGGGFRPMASIYHDGEHIGEEYGIVGFVSREDETGGTYFEYLGIGEYHSDELGISLADYAGDSAPYVWGSPIFYESWPSPWMSEPFTIGYSLGVWKNGTMDGILASFYYPVDGGGFGFLFDETMGGFYYELAPGYGGGMWIVEDEVYPIEMASESEMENLIPEGYCLAPVSFYDPYSQEPYLNDSFGESSSMVFVDENNPEDVVMREWGTWSSMLSGNYNLENPPVNGWSYSVNNVSMYYQRWAEFGPGKVDNSIWSNTNNSISADVAGAWMNWSYPTTGVMGGKLKGTFDPNTSIYTWQAVAGGVMMDTTSFLEMAATALGRAQLEQLNIPCIEVGSADLGGYNGSLEVNMNGTTFFSYSTGAAPRIWASGSVSGHDTSGVPYANNNTSVNISGSSGDADLNATFTMQNFPGYGYSGAPWNASVQFGPWSVVGPLKEHDVGGSVGGAAGKIVDGVGNFTGTASGVARKTPLMPN